MKIFKKSLCFNHKFFEFNMVGENFTIRRGVKKSMKEGEYFYLKCIPEYGKCIVARHLKTQVMRYCDIPSFDKWHLKFDKGHLKFDKWYLNSVERDPFKTMCDIYDGFEKDEIVTLIWFQVS